MHSASWEGSSRSTWLVITELAAMQGVGVSLLIDCLSLSLVNLDESHHSTCHSNLCLPQPVPFHSIPFHSIWFRPSPHISPLSTGAVHAEQTGWNGEMKSTGMEWNGIGMEWNGPSPSRHESARQVVSRVGMWHGAAWRHDSPGPALGEKRRSGVLAVRRVRGTIA